MPMRITLLAVLGLCLPGCGSENNSEKKSEMDVESMQRVIGIAGFAQDPSFVALQSDATTFVIQWHYCRPGKPYELLLLANTVVLTDRSPLVDPKSKRFQLLADTEDGRKALAEIAKRISPKLGEFCAQCVGEAKVARGSVAKAVGNLEIAAQGEQLLIRTKPAPQLTVQGLEASWKSRARVAQEEASGTKTK
jgi:hypothetical protein